MSHYDTLGVPRSASAAEIKAAYRRASSAAHPDREGGSDAAMQAVNRAYEVLGNPERRAHYDATGDDGEGISIEGEAQAMLCRLFSESLSVDGSSLDFVLRALFALEFETEQSKTESSLRVAKLRRRRGTVLRRTGENMFHAQVDRELTDLDKRLKACDQLLQVAEHARLLLKDYETVVDAAPSLFLRTESLAYFGSPTP